MRRHVPAILLLLQILTVSAFSPVTIGGIPSSVEWRDPFILPTLDCNGTLTAWGSLEEPLIWTTHRVVSYVDRFGVLHDNVPLAPPYYFYPHPIPTIYDLGPRAHDVVLSWHPGTVNELDVFLYAVPNPVCPNYLSYLPILIR